MTNTIFIIGLIICIGAAFLGIIAFILLKYSKQKLSKALDADYGERRS